MFVPGWKNSMVEACARLATNLELVFCGGGARAAIQGVGVDPVM